MLTCDLIATTHTWIDSLKHGRVVIRYKYKAISCLPIVMCIQGFTRMGGLESPARNLEIEYGYYISYLHVTEHKYVSSKSCLENFVPDCFRIYSNLRGCKFMPQTP